MKYKITNCNRFLKLAGLYPSEEKIVSELSDSLIYLYKKDQISITKIEDKKIPTKSKAKDCEVMNTDGRSNNPEELC